MIKLTRDEAKAALIAMTKAGVQFDANVGNLDADKKPQGVLVLKEDNTHFITAYTKIASEFLGHEVGMYSVGNPGRKPRSEIYDTELVKSMCGYCQDLGKGRG